MKNKSCISSHEWTCGEPRACGEEMDVCIFMHHEHTCFHDFSGAEFADSHGRISQPCIKCGLPEREHKIEMANYISQSVEEAAKREEAYESKTVSS